MQRPPVVPVSFIIQFCRCEVSGGLLGLCTGRGLIAAKWVADAMDINIPCVLLGGAAIYDFNKQQYYEFTNLMIVLMRY